jgi:predicted outer membrane repeat protein
MKKILLLSFFSVAFFTLSIAQPLQYTKWKKYDTGFNDTIIMNFRADTYTVSSNAGITVNIITGVYTENSGIVTFQDLSGPGACPSSQIGTYKFSIINNIYNTILQFKLINDPCIERATMLNGSSWDRMPGIRINVPDDYSSISQGIDAANNGDTIVVSAGIYYEQINFMGKKPLIVASEFLLDGDPSHISNTVIDGSLAADPDNASVVYFKSGEDTTSVLCGFTIQHGKGTFIPDDFGDWDSRAGGGIWIAGAGAKIINNRITHNLIDDTQSKIVTNVNGAGIGTPYEDSDSWIVICNNTIDSNKCISNHYQASGAGISTSYSTMLLNNVISHNSNIGQLDASSVGAGLSMGGELYWINPLVMIAEHNIITHNISIASGMANSAGVLIQAAQVKFSENEVSENNVVDGFGIDYSGGGGMFLLNARKGSVVSSNKFIGNTSNAWSGAIHLKNFEVSYDTTLIENNYFVDNQAKYGGAVSSLEVPFTMQNNILSGNHAISYGGALYLRNSEGLMVNHLARIINSTFTGNIATVEGGAIYSKTGNPLIVNSIFWQDTDQNGIEINSASGLVEIAYSDIDLSEITGCNLIGPGVIAQDPLFNDDIILTTEPWSPCVDAGTAIYLCSHNDIIFAPAYDITGAPRLSAKSFDMGAYDTELSMVGLQSRRSGLPLSVWPNPFANSVTFTYTLAESSQVNLRVYDSYGQLVTEPVNALQQKGEQRVEWNADNLPAGIYYCRLQAGERIVTSKIIKSRQ